ncbi:putative transposase [Rhodoblastus acidophilus]|uniref:Putative transposase n=1 Tax=Rhodoblastus acidophilus TaxID=1074 RepID=A0A212RH44_RHOAC|nr:DDE-type integrase/transposase/recombinase [Rhodoblastus acidophilus]PPQ39557.1 hypothetical protein CKO16_04760 [Rhodoblastus acidophilus]RAI24340.1 hypothetical protein CH337_00140 [Rhodoblastus acidophilus]SNB71736.1 putative transposase [Rhodoblastus acidophilus]
MNVHSPGGSAPVRIWKFDKDDLIGIGRHDFSLVESTPEGHVLARLDNPSITQNVSHADIERWRGTTGFRHVPNHFSAEKQKALAKGDISYLSDLPAKVQSTILWKWEFCRRFLEMEQLKAASRSDDGLGRAIDAIHAVVSKMDIGRKIVPEKKNRLGIVMAEATVVERKKPCAATVRDWLIRLEGYGFDLRVLRDGRYRSGNRNGLDPDVKALLDNAINGVCGATDERRVPVARIVENLAVALRKENANRASDDQLSRPCDKTISNHARKLPQFLRYAGRHGIDAARKRYPANSSGIDVTRPLQRVEIDEWRVPLHVLLTWTGAWNDLTDKKKKKLKRVRVWVCVAIDVATRCILGMRLSETVASTNSMAVLEMMVGDKTDMALAVGAKTPWDMFGRPHQIASDWGGSLVSRRVVAAIMDLQVASLQPPRGCPSLRAHIERVFRTVGTQLISRFTGQTFANVVAKAGYDSEKRASLTVAELCRCLVLYVVDVYHNLPHDGLGGETPREAWLRLTKNFPIAPPPDMDAARAIFGEHLAKPLGPNGVEFAGIPYQSPELQQLFRDKGKIDVEMRVHLKDLRRASVLIDGAWRPAPCIIFDEDRLKQSLSLGQWKAVAGKLNREYPGGRGLDNDIVLNAIKEIQRVSEDAVRLRGIGSTIPSEKAIARAERDIMLGFTMPPADADWPDREPVAPKDFRSRVVPTGSGGAPSPAAPSTGASSRTIRTEKD